MEQCRVICILGVVAVLVAGCGGNNTSGGAGGEAGGQGGAAGAGANADLPPEATTYVVECVTGFAPNDPPSELPIDLEVDPQGVFLEAVATDVSLDAQFVLPEELVGVILDNPFLASPNATINSASVTVGNSPAMPMVSLFEAEGTPFTVDLTNDPDGNGVPGPVELPLSGTELVTPNAGATSLEIGIDTASVSVTVQTVFGPQTLVFPDACTVFFDSTGEPTTFPVLP